MVEFLKYVENPDRYEKNSQDSRVRKLAIKNLMETMNWPVEQAMNALKVPEAEKQKYLDMIKNVNK